jgi:hypothetical protein
MAQSEGPAIGFAAADVHVCPAGVRDGGLYLHANRLQFHCATTLDTDRFEIVAKIVNSHCQQDLSTTLQASWPITFWQRHYRRA